MISTTYNSEYYSRNLLRSGNRAALLQWSQDTRSWKQANSLPRLSEQTQSNSECSWNVAKGNCVHRTTVLPSDTSNCLDLTLWFDIAEMQSVLTRLFNVTGKTHSLTEALSLEKKTRGSYDNIGRWCNERTCCTAQEEENRGNKKLNFCTPGWCDSSYFPEDDEWVLFHMSEVGVRASPAALSALCLWRSPIHVPLCAQPSSLLNMF